MVTLPRRLLLLLAAALMVAVMVLVTAGPVLAAPCGASCEGPPPIPSGASNDNAFAHANPNAYDALLNNALKRQGPK